METGTPYVLSINEQTMNSIEPINSGNTRKSGSTTKILSASFLDILFDGRNKAYGAYELITTYGKRMGWL